jgi:NAD(P)-dependent dehydrogenase (short-subunit alcohol dehydrogenase family)
MCKAALPHLKPGAKIVNTGSITGLEGSEKLLDYSSTKGAIHAFTKSLAQNLLEKGIRVNCIAPGPVWTPLNVADRPAEDVFFASDADSSYVTGEILTLLGGETTAA